MNEPVMPGARAWIVYLAAHQDAEYWSFIDIRTNEDDANQLAKSLKAALSDSAGEGIVTEVLPVVLDAGSVPQPGDQLYQVFLKPGVRGRADLVETAFHGMYDDPAWTCQRDMCGVNLWPDGGAVGMQWGSDPFEAMTRFAARAIKLGYRPEADRDRK